MISLLVRELHPTERTSCRFRADRLLCTRRGPPGVGACYETTDAFASPSPPEARFPGTRSLRLFAHQAAGTGIKQSGCPF